MKNKLFILLLIISNSSFAQSDATKEETQEWIIKKIEQYSRPSGSFYTRKWSSGDWGDVKTISGTAKLSFSEDGYILFETFYSYWVEVYRYPDNREYETKSTHTIKIPIYSIVDFRSGEIISNCECIEDSYFSEKKKQALIFIFDSAEPSITERMKKALLHLKTFYPNPNANEKF